MCLNASIKFGFRKLFRLAVEWGILKQDAYEEKLGTGFISALHQSKTWL